MGDLLAYHAERDPTRVAVHFQDDAVTYGALDRWANRLARAYAERGVGFGDLVTIALPNGIEFYAASFATFKLGAIPQPLPHRLPRPERDGLIDVGEPALVVGVEPDESRGRPSVPRGFEPPPDTLDTPVAAVVGPSFKAMASGGSTGRPKLIVAKVPAEFDPETPAVQMQPGDVQLVPGPLYHNGPYSFSMFDLFVGGTLVVMERFDAAETLRLIERYRVQWVFFVPTMMHRIWRLPNREQYDVSSLRTVFSTGAPWPVWLKEAWIGWLGPDVIREGYGGTESQGGTSITGHESLERPGSVGLPQQGALVRILDADGNPLGVDQVGRVFVGNQSRFDGYTGGGNKENIDGLLSSGDLGHFDGKGRLFIDGRDDDMIVSGGENVFPAEVEDLLAAHDAVLEVAVFGVDDEKFGQRLKAVVVTKKKMSADEVKNHVKSNLAGYKVPRDVEFVKELPRTSTGKVLKRELKED